jgi:hypothetical protein
MLTTTPTTALATALFSLADTLAQDPTADSTVTEAIRSLARKTQTSAQEDETRAADLAEMYRQATNAELQTISGIRYFLNRLQVPLVGPAAAPDLLRPVALRLVELGAVEAAMELQRAIALTKTRAWDYAGLFVNLAIGFLAQAEARAEADAVSLPKQSPELPASAHIEAARDVAYGQHAGHLAGDVRRVVETVWAAGGNAEDGLCAIEAYCKLMRAEFPPWR